MHRQPEHVIQFLFSEMGTTGSVDGAGRLVIKGRFQQKQVENVLRRYIGVYHPLLSSGSSLNRLFDVQWNMLHARHANHQIRCLRRRIVSSSCRASLAGQGGLLTLSRVASRRKSGRGAKTRQADRSWKVYFCVHCILFVSRTYNLLPSRVESLRQAFLGLRCYSQTWESRAIQSLRRAHYEIL